VKQASINEGTVDNEGIAHFTNRDYDRTGYETASIAGTILPGVDYKGMVL
jgi:hypothetical protein